jgi:hypothetical protein
MCAHFTQVGLGGADVLRWVVTVYAHRMGFLVDGARRQQGPKMCHEHFRLHSFLVNLAHSSVRCFSSCSATCTPQPCMKPTSIPRPSKRLGATRNTVCELSREA